CSSLVCSALLSLFFFTDTATTEIYTLSLHDALPICRVFAELWSHIIKEMGNGKTVFVIQSVLFIGLEPTGGKERDQFAGGRTFEIGKHTSELQSRENLVCRLLLEKKKKKNRRVRNT